MADNLSQLDEQSIKSARFYYQIFLLVCFTALVFSFSPQEKNVNQGAVKELNCLILFSDDIDSLIIDIANTDKKYSDNLQKLVSILSEYNLNFQHNDSQKSLINFDGAGSHFKSVLNGSLELIDREFKTYSLRVSYWIIDGSLEYTLRSFLDNNKGEFLKWGQNVQITQYETAKISFHFSKGASTSEKINFNISKEQVTIPINWHEYFLKLPQYNIFLSKAGDHFLFLPNLKQVWDQIRSQRIEEARAILARKETPQEKKLEVVGLSIPQSLISWTMPVILCVLTLCLLVHIQHLHKTALNNQPVRNYPWIVIMKGRLAFVLSIGTLLLLPVVCLLGIVSSTWQGQVVFLKIFTITVSICTLCVLGLIMIQVWRIRKIE